MYNKEGKIKLETSAHYVPIGKTNISFYDSDIGTADLVFYITRNQQPLEVSDENVDCHIVLVAKDGSYIVDNATIVDSLNGKAKFTIPSAFLTHTGEVKGQVFIAVHGVDDMVTEVEFTFNIQSSLVSTVPAVDKLNYIRTFDDLKQVIVERVQYIEDAIANGEDYVTQMDNTFQSGMRSLNDRSAQVIDEIKALADNHKQGLNDLKDSNITELDNKANQIKEDIEELNNYDTSNWQKYKLTESNGNRIRVSDIDPVELGTGFYQIWDTYNMPFTTEGSGSYWNVDVFSAMDTKQIQATLSYAGRVFQKNIHKGVDSGWKELTNNNTRQWLGTLGSEESGYNSVLDLPPGLYECSIPPDAFEVGAPLDPNGAGYIASIDVYGGNDKRKQIKLVGNYRNDVYHATVHTKNEDNPNGNFRGWKRVMNAEEFEAKNSDTGWIDWNTKNGATKRETDNEQALGCHYRIKTINDTKFGFIRVNVNNIESQMVIGSIPKEYLPKAQNFYIRTPVSKSAAVLLLDTDGGIKVYLNLNDRDDWIPSQYVVGEFSWIIDETGSGF